MITQMILGSVAANVGIIAGIVVALLVLGPLVLYATCFKKAIQGQALVRTGIGQTKVSFDGMLVIPVLHRYEIMDISVKKIGNR